MRASCREVLRCLLEGLKWLQGPTASVRVAGKSGISQARVRLGIEPVRELHDQLVKPIAKKTTKGAWYRGWRLVSIDGSTMDVADTQANPPQAAAIRRYSPLGTVEHSTRPLSMKSWRIRWSRVAAGAIRAASNAR